MTRKSIAQGKSAAEKIGSLNENKAVILSVAKGLLFPK